MILETSGTLVRARFLRHVMKDPWILLLETKILEREIKIYVNPDTQQLMFSYTATKNESEEINNQILEALKMADITPEYITLDLVNRN